MKDTNKNTIAKGLGNHNLDIRFDQYNGKYHPERIIINLENNKNVNIIFGKSKEYKKLKDEKNGKNLIHILVQPKDE